MSQRITIEIKNKIATCLTELPIVCGNSDYVVDFAFDEEWDAHEVKTAIFVVNGKSTEQVFAGNVCPVPVIQNTLITWVGVFAGAINDGTLSTSTPALVKCIPCITDGDKVPLPPPDDVYNQIIALLESGILRGPQGEKGDKGDKGDAGAVKFVPVTELPTENIEEDAIYLLPVADDTEENRFTEYAYINGKWEVLGAISIQVDHSEYVKKTDYARDGVHGLVKIDATFGIGFPNGISAAIAINRATDEMIKNRAGMYRPLTGGHVDLIVKEGLTNSKLEWTEEEKAKARALLGCGSRLHKHFITFSNGIEIVVFTTSPEPYTVDNIKTIGKDYLFAKYKHYQIASLETNSNIIVFMVIGLATTGEYIVNLEEETMTDMVTVLG